MVLSISLPASFLHREQGRDGELQLFWEGVNVVEEIPYCIWETESLSEEQSAPLNTQRTPHTGTSKFSPNRLNYPCSSTPTTRGQRLSSGISPNRRVHSQQTTQD